MSGKIEGLHPMALACFARLHGMGSFVGGLWISDSRYFAGFERGTAIFRKASALPLTHSREKREG